MIITRLASEGTEALPFMRGYAGWLVVGIVTSLVIVASLAVSTANHELYAGLGFFHMVIFTIDLLVRKNYVRCLLLLGATVVMEVIGHMVPGTGAADGSNMTAENGVGFGTGHPDSIAAARREARKRRR